MLVNDQQAPLYARFSAYRIRNEPVIKISSIYGCAVLN